MLSTSSSVLLSKFIGPGSLGGRPWGTEVSNKIAEPASITTEAKIHHFFLHENLAVGEDVGEFDSEGDEVGRRGAEERGSRSGYLRSLEDMGRSRGG